MICLFAPLSGFLVGLTIGVAGFPAALWLPRLYANPLGDLLIAGRLEMVAVGVLFAAAGFYFSRFPFARTWFWFPALWGFFTGICFHYGLMGFVVDERFPMAVVALGWAWHEHVRIMGGWLKKRRDRRAAAAAFQK